MNSALELLEQDEREATALLREAQQKKRDLLAAQAELEQLAEAEAHQAYLERLRPVKELTVLGVNRAKLNEYVRHTRVLRVLRVHPDVVKLLRTALASRSEQEFLQLVSALAARLCERHRDILQIVDDMHTDSEMVAYFEHSKLLATLVIVTTQRSCSHASEALAMMLTGWALEFGRVTQYGETE